MRVITGLARGAKLMTLEGNDVRPTTDMVKEALFSIIQFEVEGANFLDLYCGSGQLGIEALSRGAKRAVFVDSSKMSVGVTRENLQNTNLFKSSLVSQMDVKDFLRSARETFDIIVMDPPYDRGLAEETLPLAIPHLKDTGMIICETSAKEELPEEIMGFSVKKSYKYGKIKLTTYVKSEVE